MSKTTWFQISLLGIWGVSAVAALSGSFWLTQAEWVQAFKADTELLDIQQTSAVDPAVSVKLRDEVLVLRQAVMRLDRQNRILMSRLEVVEKETGEFTASIPSSPDRNRNLSSQPSAQQMPDAINSSLKQRDKMQSGDRVFTRVDPYPLKLHGTNRAPTDAEISQALKGH